MKTKSDVSISVKGCANSAGIQNLVAGSCDVLIFSGKPDIFEQHKVRKAFHLSRKEWLEAYPIGRFVSHIVVHTKNPVRRLTYHQLHEVFRGRIKDWRKVGGRVGGIKLYGERYQSKAGDIASNEFMHEWYFAHSYKELRDCYAVAPDVAKDPNAIGLYLDRGGDVKGVGQVAVSRQGSEPYYLPTQENIFEGKYPLMEDLTLYLHPKAPPQAKAYCEFAIGPEGGKIAKKWYLYSEYERQQYFGRKRLAAMKAGKGVAIRGVGSMGGSAVMRDLAIEYVKAEKVVQMACRPAVSELTAVGYFVNSKDRELLVLDGAISEQAKKLHGKKWDFLDPETHVLASGRGIAICVNSMNKLGTLTLEQVRHLFSKKTTTWRDVTGAEVKVKRYGLAGTDPAARVFYSRINPPAACARPDTRLGTQAVLAALSRDPHGIAFVDAAAANDLLGAAGGKSGIKVLAIGQAGKATSPTAANVKAGKYPISQQLTLHVSPRASQTTRDFVKFVLSGAADEIFTKHGLITPAQARKAAANAPKKPRKRSPKKKP